MIKGVIFDLDQTLVDSSIAEQIRKQRNWLEVYKLIPSFHLYDGFKEVFEYLKSSNIRTCIVTSSPSKYAERVVNHFGTPCEFIVDYYSTTNRKPHPDPMLKALERFNLSNSEVISFGDAESDIIASNKAGIKSVACAWGTINVDSLKEQQSLYFIQKPIEIITIIQNL